MRIYNIGRAVCAAMTKILERLALSRQDYMCRVCRAPVGLSSYFAFPIPPSDPYWARVYGNKAATASKESRQRLKAYCSEACAPEWALKGRRTADARVA